jgi:hypothetical protein
VVLDTGSSNLAIASAACTTCNASATSLIFSSPASGAGDVTVLYGLSEATATWWETRNAPHSCVHTCLGREEPPPLPPRLPPPLPHESAGSCAGAATFASTLLVALPPLRRFASLTRINCFYIIFKGSQRRRRPRRRWGLKRGSGARAALAARPRTPSPPSPGPPRAQR